MVNAMADIDSGSPISYEVNPRTVEVEFGGGGDCLHVGWTHEALSTFVSVATRALTEAQTVREASEAAAQDQLSKAD
jgi:hypothetical protein